MTCPACWPLHYGWGGAPLPSRKYVPPFSRDVHKVLITATIGPKNARLFGSNIVNKLDGVATLITDPPGLASPLIQKMKIVTSDMLHVTCDTGHVKHDTWLMTYDRWWKGNPLSKLQLPSFYGLGVKVFWRYFHNGSVTKLKSLN